MTTIPPTVPPAIAPAFEFALAGCWTPLEQEFAAVEDAVALEGLGGDAPEEVGAVLEAALAEDITGFAWMYASAANGVQFPFACKSFLMFAHPGKSTPV